MDETRVADSIPIVPTDAASGEGIVTLCDNEGQDALSKEDFSMDSNTSELNAVKQMSQGVLAQLKPEIDYAQARLDELIRNQTVLSDATQQEITQLSEYALVTELNGMFQTVKTYHGKLLNIKKEMKTLQDRVEKSKAKALRLQIQKQKEELFAAQQKELQLKHEQNIMARPAKPTS